jgi:asparagine synthase (glutamine-hydrolysing)
MIDAKASGVSRKLALAARIMLKDDLAYGPIVSQQDGALSAGIFHEEPFTAWNDPLALMRAELRGPLAGRMLHKTDRVTMRSSLEARVPYLDDRMVAFAGAIPWEWKVHHGTTKWLIREAIRHKLPDSIANRPKRGFRVPLDQWFREALRPALLDRLNQRSPVQQFMREGAPSRLVEEHLSGRNNHGIKLWVLMVLDHWLRKEMIT